MADSGGKGWQAWLTAGLGASAGSLLTSLVASFRTEPAALLALALGVLLVVLMAAVAAAWLTRTVVHAAEHRIVLDRCARLEARWEELQHETFVSQRIAGIAVKQQVEGGPLA